jgi:protein phosphatase
MAGRDRRADAAPLAFLQGEVTIMNQSMTPPDGIEIPKADAPVATLTAEAPYLQVDCCGRTDRGKVRPNNEDQFLIARLTKAMQVLHTSLPEERIHYGKDQGYLFVVADGMGGHAAGETASALVIDSLERFVLNTCKWFFQLQGRDGDKVLAEFQTALQQADARILAEAARHHELTGMGSTLTMAYSLNRDLFVAHVGDSRCYLFRDDVLHRLTQDHTMVEELVRHGYIEPDEAAHHRLRHVITNAIGGNSPGVQVEVHKVSLEAGDRILLCTDGLTEMVPDEEIAEVLRAHRPLPETCTQLITQANERGGKDNVTVVLAEFGAGG